MGGVNSIQVFLDFFNFFNFAKPLNLEQNIAINIFTTIQYLKISIFRSVIFVSGVAPFEPKHCQLAVVAINNQGVYYTGRQSYNSLLI